MRIIILNQFFYPDHSATSQLMTDLAESLVERGVEVTALSGRGRYNGGEPLAKREEYRGVFIERAWATSRGKGSLVARLSDYLSFYLGASWRLLRLPRHDVVMVLTTPPLIGVVAALIGRARGMRVVSLVQDLYPDVAVALGALRRGKLSTRLLDAVSRFVLRKSERVIVLGECMRERIVEKLGEEYEERVDVIHNWADGQAITPFDEKENPFVAEHDLDGSFVVLFSGNLGRVNEFSTVLDAARRLRSRADIKFLFIGEGARSEEIKAFAREHDLKQVLMLPYQPRERLRYSLAAGHAHLVTLADGLSGLSVPSKTYGILAAGRPVLYVGDARSATARVVMENSCGVVVESGDGERLAGVIIEWAEDRGKLGELNTTARKAFEKHFDRARAVDSYLETFNKCAEKSQSPDEPCVQTIEETSR